MNNVFEMAKGSNVPLDTVPDATGPGRLQAVLSWDIPAGDVSVDADISALLVTETGQVRTDEDLVFYNQPAATDGSVRHVAKRMGTNTALTASTST